MTLPTIRPALDGGRDAVTAQFGAASRHRLRDAWLEKCRLDPELGEQRLRPVAETFAHGVGSPEVAGAAAFLTRLLVGSMPAFSGGTTTFPRDGFGLLDVADRRLYSKRADGASRRRVAASMSQQSGDNGEA